MANLLEVKDKVQRYLAANFKGVMIDDEGDYSFRFDSARVFVRVGEWTDGRVVIDVFSVVLQKVPLTTELKDYVALECGSFVFGRMALFVDPEGMATLTFRQSLLGDFLDEEELTTACGLVGSVAEIEDDKLKERFGGLRFHED
jgi:hypothetical protein